MRILLVGTEEHGTGNLVRGLGEEVDVEVQQVADGAAAIELLYGFDAVVTRLALGPGDEIELIRWIHRKRPKLPLVILSPNTTVDRAVACMRAGATDFLPVTVAPAALLAVLRRAVGEMRLREQANGARGPGGSRAQEGSDGSRGRAASAPGVPPGTNGDHSPLRGWRPAVLEDHDAPAGPVPEGGPVGVLMPPGLTLAEVERRYIEATLENFGGDYGSLAAQLGISRKTLWEKRRRLTLQRLRPEGVPIESRSA